MKIAVAGTGYVGLSIATLLSQNHEVMAVDIIPEKVEKINKRISPIQDEYIEKYLKEKELNLTATLDAESALSVFCTFFVAELGDKTQLTAITFGANEGLSSAVVVWLACSLGLFAADVIGLLIGYLLKSKAPEGILNTVAFVIFSIFGILTLRQGFGLLLGAGSSMILPLTVAVTVVFVIVCLVLYKQAKKN